MKRIVHIHAIHLDGFRNVKAVTDETDESVVETYKETHPDCLAVYMFDPARDEALAWEIHKRVYACSVTRGPEAFEAWSRRVDKDIQAHAFQVVRSFS